MNLNHLMYISQAERKFSTAELTDLLTIARNNNRSLDVTGILLYKSNYFFQVLEGEFQVIKSLFKRILTDDRHHDVIQLKFEPIAGRHFGSWSMGFMNDTDDKADVLGMNDFFSQSDCLTQIKDGFSKEILTSLASYLKKKTSIV